MKRLTRFSLLLLVFALAFVLPVFAQDATEEPAMEEEVQYDPEACFRPAPDNDTTVSFPAVEPPYTIGLSNSFIGNAWRTQMIQMAQAWAATPEVAPLIDELIVVSTGEDVEAQIAAMDNMIALGVDAIILNAATPTGFDAVIRRAADAGIIVVSFDNIVTAPEAVLVNEDQVEFGRVMAEDLVERMGGEGNVVMVNGVPGTSVDTDRNTGAKEVFEQYPDITVIAELEGMWGSGVAQQVMADFLATQPEIDGVWIQGGGPGVIQAFDDAGYALVPMAGEAENGFRRALAERQDEGLVGISVGQTPGMVAVAMQAALELLQGRELPRSIAMPLPLVTSEDIEEGVHYFEELPDDFFTPIKIPECGVNLDPEEILAIEVE
ncbi:MAG TPA: sugar ABC transporter substrate-binding protein [Oceanobacillus sp.]|nr:sugar ABC transporter substrate-binding protein [Oceanobacillus sp.]